MIVSVWLTHKTGEPRIYTTTAHPTEEQLAAFKRDGFRTFEARVIIPVWEDSVVEVTHGFAWPVDSGDGQGTGQRHEQLQPGADDPPTGVTE